MNEGLKGLERHEGEWLMTEFSFHPDTVSVLRTSANVNVWRQSLIFPVFKRDFVSS